MRPGSSILKRAKRAIYRVAKDATRSRSSPRSFAEQRTLAQDDNLVVGLTLIGCAHSMVTEGITGN